MLKNITKFLSGSNEGAINKIRREVVDINAFEPELERLSDEQLRAKTEEFRNRLKEGEDLDDLLYEAFATVREASKRTLSMRHFDVQMIGGIVLHEGKIAEMRTGEGKTLAATLPAYLNSLNGKGVHIVTVNDYLARRDAQWMGVIYDILGVSVGVLQNDGSLLYVSPPPEEPHGDMANMVPASRTEAYQADITYGTNNEFGFDYLRDNMVVDLAQRSQRELPYAIVDEVDNILIDEARTPLIISGPAETAPKEYHQFARLAPSLVPDEDFTIDEKHRSVALSIEGITKLEKQLNVRNLYAPENLQLVHFVENAVKAQTLFLRDREYVVRDGEVIIVDEFTGRLMTGRRYSDGLHQALEAKEGLSVQRETITYATITLQNYFRIYKKLAGMTGTAETEAEEFHKIYKLEVVVIPTNQPTARDDKTDLIFRDQKAKYAAVVNAINEHHKAGLPVLVGTTDIDQSELLSEMLTRKGVPHEVLNAKQHVREALIVAQAGRPGAITVATNMAGRGTDIVLGGTVGMDGLTQEQWEKDHQKIVELGGLHIIGTERHDARRIDNQLRGRAGRQGDPGNTRFYVALDDSLMRRFGGDRIRTVMEWAGLDEDTPIENKMISKSIEGAQVKVEAYHFDIRKQLVEYDDVVNIHRDVIYGERNKILSGVDLKSNIQSMIENSIKEILASYLTDRPENWNIESMSGELDAIMPLPPEFSSPDDVVEMYPDDIEARLLEHAQKMYVAKEEEMTPDVMRVVERQLMLRIIDSNWVQHLTSMENLRQGIGLYAYGQRDPLVMYKKEGHAMFQNLQARMQHDIAHSIFHIGIAPQGGANGGGTAQSNRQRRRAAAKNNESIMTKVAKPSSREAVAAGNRKLGRNDPCYCGSGKKYKRCHGS